MGIALVTKEAKIHRFHFLVRLISKHHEEDVLYTRRLDEQTQEDLRISKMKNKPLPLEYLKSYAVQSKIPESDTFSRNEIL